MKKRMSISIIFPLMVLAGCFDYDQTMVIRKDGSGTVGVRYEVEKAYLEQIKEINEAMAEQSGEKVETVDPAETMFARTEIEKTLAEDQSGIKLLVYERSETEDTRIWNMAFSFTDINDLDALADALSADKETYGGPSEDSPSYDRQADGTWLYIQPFMQAEGESDEEMGSEEFSDEDTGLDLEEDDTAGMEMDEESPVMEEWSQDMKDLVESMASHRVRVSVEFPGEVVESNATSVAGRTAVWEYTLRQMPDAPEELRAVIK